MNFLNHLKVWWANWNACDRCRRHSTELFGLCRECVLQDFRKYDAEEAERKKNELKGALREVLQEEEFRKRNS